MVKKETWTHAFHAKIGFSEHCGAGGGKGSPHCGCLVSTYDSSFSDDFLLAEKLQEFLYALQ